MIKKRTNRGITLVALVITIIVLLILVGVSLSLTIGENGILSRAKDSSARYEKARENERVQLVIADAQMRSNSNRITYKNLKDAADNEFGPGKYDLEYDLTEKQFKLTIHESGNVYNIPADSSDIANELKEIAKGDNSTITQENIIAAANEIFGKDNYDLVHNGDKFEIIPNSGDGENKIIINEDGSDVEVKVRNLVTASMIKNNPSTYYGKNVNYTATVKNQENNSDVNVTGWKIFHADDNNIYLIADNFINANLCPSSSKSEGKRPTYALGTDPRVKFDNGQLVESYAGASDITTSNPARKWLSQYFNFNDNNSSGVYGMRIIAYLLDTVAWAPFANSNVADYAIGTPTIEMFADSYNALYPNSITIEVQEEWNVKGYKVKISKDYVDYDDHGLDNTNSLYFSANNIQLWLASPTPTMGNYLLNLYPMEANYHDGGIGRDNATNYNGNR